MTPDDATSTYIAQQEERMVAIEAMMDSDGLTFDEAQKAYELRGYVEYEED